jgi:hypothetical protein
MTDRSPEAVADRLADLVATLDEAATRGVPVQPLFRYIPLDDLLAQAAADERHMPGLRVLGVTVYQGAPVLACTFPGSTQGVLFQFESRAPIVGERDHAAWMDFMRSHIAGRTL